MVGPISLLLIRSCRLEWEDQVGKCLYPANIYLGVLHMIITHLINVSSVFLGEHSAGARKSLHPVAVQSTTDAFSPHIQNANQLLPC